MRIWKVVSHNGLYGVGKLQYNALLTEILRVVYRENPYEEFAVGAGDAKRLATRLNTADAAQARIAELEAALRFVMAFVPEWAKEVPDGLGEMFYGTLSSVGDREVKARVDAAAALLSAREETK